MAPSIIAFVVGLVPISLALQNANWIPFIAIIVLILMISSIHVVLLGIPAFIAGWYLNRFRWWTSIAVAFVVGVLPTAVFLWPLKNPQLQTTSSRWDGEKMVQTMIQGVPTIAGWTDWLSAVMVMGLLGVSEGLVFWLI